MGENEKRGELESGSRGGRRLETDNCLGGVIGMLGRSSLGGLVSSIRKSARFLFSGLGVNNGDASVCALIGLVTGVFIHCEVPRPMLALSSSIAFCSLAAVCKTLLIG